MPLIIPPAVLKQMRSMPKTDQARIIQALKLVAADPAGRLPFVTELVGQPGYWRHRKGDWRAIYKIIGDDVVVQNIGNRREIYR